MRHIGGVAETEVVVIGAGQSGLAMGYHLKQRGVPFVVLDANERIGDAWRNRWDSLRLFSHARFDGLAGLPFPGPKTYLPTKDEMADFLEHYAKAFELPVENGTRVTRVERGGSGFLVRAGDRTIDARQVVVAMSNFQKPRVPEFASRLAPEVTQLHSSAYRNVSQLRDGKVLVVGAGNSGAEIALELARKGRRVFLSGRFPKIVPFRPDSFFGRHLFAPITLGFVFTRLLTLDTPLGRKVGANGAEVTPLIRVKPADLAAAGVVRTARVRGASGGMPVLESGETVGVENVIWCTGYHPDFSWIDLPVFNADGLPRHRRGVVDGELGLYFTGLYFLYAMSSSSINGASRDAAYVADAVARRMRTAGSASTNSGARKMA
jgi:putative flavoprotein involved in K+ transport